MREIVIIPAWRRPDFLTACLSRLDLSDDGQRQYLISLDRNHTQTVVEAAGSFQDVIGDKRVRIVSRDHDYGDSNSYNTLMAYGDAVNWGADLIHLVEDDVFTGIDYFTAHHEAHALVPDAWGVGGCNFFPGTDPTALNMNLLYHSLGVSFRPRILEQYILPHAVHEYFSDRSGYCRKRFGFDGRWDQDGLIENLRRQQKMKFAVMDVPRAYHAGYTGYSRVGTHFLKPEETCRNHIVEAAAKLLRMDTAELNERALFDKDYKTADLDRTRPPISCTLK